MGFAYKGGMVVHQTNKGGNMRNKSNNRILLGILLGMIGMVGIAFADTMTVIEPVPVHVPTRFIPEPVLRVPTWFIPEPAVPIPLPNPAPCVGWNCDNIEPMPMPIAPPCVGWDCGDVEPMPMPIAPILPPPNEVEPIETPQCLIPEGCNQIITANS